MIELHIILIDIESCAFMQKVYSVHVRCLALSIMYEYTVVLQQILVTHMYVVIKMNMVPFLIIANYVAQTEFLVPNSNYLSHYIIESHLFKTKFVSQRNTQN